MRRFWTILFLFLFVAGCSRGTSPNPSPAPVPSAASAVSATSLAGLASPVATRRASATPSPAPSATASPLPTSASPVPATATPVPTPVGAAGKRWEVYKSALRPAVRAGVNLDGATEYQLAVELPASLHTVHGQARIHYTNRSPDALDDVYLNLYPNLWHAGMTVDDLQVNGQAVTLTLQREDSLVAVKLPHALAPGASADLALSFAVPVPQNLEVGNYGELAYLDHVLALAHFYPTVAVYDDHWHTETPAPQGDVLFNEASLYDVTVTAPLTLTLAASGRTLERRDNGNGTAIWHLAGGPMRDFNVVASDRYEQASRQVDDVTVTSYYLPDDARGGQDALAYAASALDTLQRDFGAYPYTELDVVETSTRALGIEYPGLIVLARQGQYDAPDRRDFFRTTAAHETAHQWWYNVVGNDQVNAPWLDESLAQYTTYLYLKQVVGQQGAEAIVANFRERWGRVDNQEIPIGLPAGAYRGPAYSAIVYGRGPLFLMAVEQRIGEQTMLKFLRAYYERYAWQIATPAEFQELLQQVSGQDLSDLFKAWVYGPQ